LVRACAPGAEPFRVPQGDLRGLGDSGVLDERLPVTLGVEDRLEDQALSANESAQSIPEDASAEHGWALKLNIRKTTPRQTVNGQTDY
jgi:hypothetical protein